MPVKTIAVIGLGSIGRRHAKNALSLGYNVIGFDPSEAACKAANDKIQILAIELEAIEQSDAVIIASPHKYHMQSLENCIAANKPALVEKPIATKIDGLENLLKKAADKNLIIACGFNLRFRQIVEKAQECLKNMGNIHWARFICASYLPDWRPQSNYLENYTNDAENGGIIFDIAHELDLAQFLLGQGDVVSSYAENSGLLGLNAEDRANIILKHVTGSLSHIYLDYTTRPRQRSFEIAGKKGFLKVDLTDHSLKLYGTDNELKENICLENYDANQDYIAELKDFVEAVKNSANPKCSGEEGLQNLENILKARRLASLA